MSRKACSFFFPWSTAQYFFFSSFAVQEFSFEIVQPPPPQKKMKWSSPSELNRGQLLWLAHVMFIKIKMCDYYVSEYVMNVWNKVIKVGGMFKTA